MDFHVLYGIQLKQNVLFAFFFNEDKRNMQSLFDIAMYQTYIFLLLLNCPNYI